MRRSIEVEGEITSLLWDPQDGMASDKQLRGLVDRRHLIIRVWYVAASVLRALVRPLSSTAARLTRP